MESELGIFGSIILEVIRLLKPDLRRNIIKKLIEMENNYDEDYQKLLKALADGDINRINQLILELVQKA